MKTKEFIKRVEELGFEAHKGITRMVVVSEGLTVATVSTERVHYINCFCFVDIEWENQEKLFDLIVEYAKTPIKDREEEKKYYLRHRWENKQFTSKEIEEIKKKFDTDLKDFEFVEVEE